MIFQVFFYLPDNNYPCVFLKFYFFFHLKIQSHYSFERGISKGFYICFSVFDVGGQQGERKKWIQVFDSVVAILFLADCSSYDQTLREDRTKNRFLEALEIFEQVWKNR
jgi:hypothetical protein